MATITHERVKSPIAGPGTVLLFIIAVIGAVVMVLRWSKGLGETTNLSDQYPWGLWIGVDVMSGVALAAGGFTTAALVYLFGGEKYHGLVRPAVLTGMLGYGFVGFALLVDLALPWNIWHAIIYWPEHSAMFEVAWCVMLYLTVLVLEFLPVVFEGFKLKGLHMLWRVVTPIFSVIALTFFVFIMSHSFVWAIATFIVYAILAFILPSTSKARVGVPILLIIAGVVFSTMHQSSLGTLFLLMPDKLDSLWWTPMLPVNFFLSAVAVGFAMVMFEATLAAKLFRRPVEKEAISGMGQILMVALWIYLIVRVLDMIFRGNLGGAFGGDKSGLFLLEIIGGVILPAVILMSGQLRKSTGALFFAALLVVIGVIFNRCNVAWLGMDIPGQGTYVPSLQEIVITIGIIAMIMFWYSIIVKVLPVFAKHEGDVVPA